MIEELQKLKSLHKLFDEKARPELEKVRRDHPDEWQSFLAQWGDEGQALADHHWPQPEELGDDLLPIPAFDYEMLPEPFRDYVKDNAHRLQMPPEMIAAPLMAAAGAVIGRQMMVNPRMKDEWKEVPTVWFIGVGDPGVGKSSALAAALAPVIALEESARAAFELEYPEFVKAEKLHKMREAAQDKIARKALEKDPAAAEVCLTVGPPPKLPEPRRYIVHAVTVQKLAMTMQENPNGLIMDQDELPPLLLQLSNPDRAEDRSFYLKAWSGKQSYGFDSISRGVNRVDHMALTIIGGAQPGPLRGFLQDAVKKGGDDGLFARFGLLIWPDYGEEKEVDEEVDERARGEVFSAFLLLNNISRRFETDCMRFSEDGRAAYVEWVNDLSKRFRVGKEPQALISHCKKYKSLVPSLALIIALVEDETESVSESAVRRAVLWANYLEQHARRAYGSVATGGVSEAKLIIEKIRAGCLPPKFTARQIKLKGWSGLAGDSVGQALELLAECGWIRATPRKTGGRPTIDYEPTFGGFDVLCHRYIQKS